MSQLAKLLIASALLTTAAASIAQNTGASNSMTTPAGSADNAGAVITPMVKPNAAGMPLDNGASGASGTTGATAAGTTGTAASTSSDPYVQKREADAAAKAEYKAKKKAAKSEYKHEKASAKSDMKMEKRESKAERNSTITADPAKTVAPGQQSNLGK